MKERYEVKEMYDGDDYYIYGYGIHDRLTGLEVSEDEKLIIGSKTDMLEKCQQLNTESEEKRKSEAIMKVASIGGVGVNLCNEYNFIDLWEVVEWVSSTYGNPKFYVVKDDRQWGINVLFSHWFDTVGLWAMTQHEMQTAIVNKIYDLMVEAGLIGDNDES